VGLKIITLRSPLMASPAYQISLTIYKSVWKLLVRDRQTGDLMIIIYFLFSLVQAVVLPASYK
jgi:hypothetical protein